MTHHIDGSYQVIVDQNAWGDVSITLPGHDLTISLDPAEAARICAEIWAALGRDEQRRTLQSESSLRSRAVA